MLQKIIKYAKHIVKLAFGQPEYFWYMNKVEECIRPETFTGRHTILSWAEQCLVNKEKNEDPHLYENSTDPVVRQGWALKNKVEKQFRNTHGNLKNMRILVHVPDEKSSPAGYSLLQNLVEAFSFIGIPAETIFFGESTKNKLTSFKPTILMTSDHGVFLRTLDWNEITQYRQNNKLLIGLTASYEAQKGITLAERLTWAKKHAVDFYYSYREDTYVRTQAGYAPYYDAGYTIFSIPFGANPLIHYPVPNIVRDINYSFIASTNKTKARRYYAYMKPVIQKYIGFIDGPGWKKVPDFNFNRARDRYIYARTKMGLNMHLDEQVKWASETNERTYQLAACGVPQVTDHAKLFDTLFGTNTLFVSDTPAQYSDNVELIMTHPNEIESNVLKAQKEVFEKYTTFHRASNFVTMLSIHFKLN